MVRRLLLLASLLVVLTPAQAQAQTQNPLTPLDTSSPRATMASFFEQLERVEQSLAAYRDEKTWANRDALEAAFDEMRPLFDLSEVPPAARREVGGASAVLLADILLRLPETPPDEIPGGPAFDPETGPDLWTVPETEIRIARMVEGPQAGEYLFTAATVARLPEFHARIIDYPLRRPSPVESWRTVNIYYTGPLFPAELGERIPESLRFLILGTPAWKALFTLAIGTTALIVVAGWTRLVLRWARERTSLARLAAFLTVPALVAATTWQLQSFVTYQLNLSGTFAQGTSIALVVALIVAVAWAAWLATYLLVEFVISSPAIPDQSYDANFLRLVARVGAVVGAGSVVVYGANHIGVPALGLIAGLGVGGIALALAAQSTVENLFGGVNIFADRPFRVGDFIRYGGELGTVERIGPRSSRIRGLDSTVTTVPNGDLARMHITNYSFREKILFRHVLNLRYETSPDQFVWLTETLRQRLAAHPRVERTDDHPRVRVLGFNTSSIDVEVRAYVLTTNYSEFLEVQEELVLATMRIVAKGGAGFAFPSQTAYLTRDQGLDQEAARRVEAEIDGRRRRPDLAHGDPEGAPETAER